MIITAIEPQKRSEQRVNVFADNKFWVSLDIYQLIELGIKMGIEIDDVKKEEIEEASLFGKAYAAALNFMSIRPRSRKEISDYAWKKKWDPLMRDKVIERLESKGYLNDTAFARQWVGIRESGRPMSKRRVLQELRVKGIPASSAEEALTGYDEHEALKHLVEKKRSRYPDEIKFKQYLLRQGFSYESINEALKNNTND